MKQDENTIYVYYDMISSGWQTASCSFRMRRDAVRGDIYINRKAHCLHKIQSSFRACCQLIEEH